MLFFYVPLFLPQRKSATFRLHVYGINKLCVYVVKKDRTQIFYDFGLKVDDALD